jgi:hypothetical protein
VSEAESLGDRIVAAALREHAVWGDQPVPASQVTRYLLGCERGGKNIGDWLAAELARGVHISFCAAARGWCTRQIATRGEALPPWRAGAREMMQDAIASGTWLAAADMRAGKLPPVGSAIIYWRISPVSAFGHVETLIECDTSGFFSIGANEHGGRWYRDQTRVSWAHPQLLGACAVGVAPQHVSAPPQVHLAGPASFFEPVMREDEIRHIEAIQFTQEQLNEGVPRHE